MRRMRNNNLEIRIADPSCRPQLKTRLTLRGRIANSSITYSTSHHLLPSKFPMKLRLRMIKKENDSLQQNYTILVTLPPYLSFSSFGIMNKSHAVNTATNSVLRHPLMSVLPSLCSNSFDSRASAQWNLQPLTVPAVARAPWPAVIYSPVPWGQVVIVICRGWEIAWD